MIDVILIEPGHPGNLGAVARACKNFGFPSLILVEPKASKRDEEARNRAKWAQDVLAKAKVVKKRYLDRYDILVSTSGKLGTDYNLKRSPLTPEQLAEKVMRPATRRKRIGVVFGRESSGLTNEEIARCDFLVSIPGARGYPIFNLSHAVAIVLYELRKGAGADSQKERFPLLDGKEKRMLLRQIDAAIRSLGFSSKDKEDTQRKLWRGIVGKAMLTRREGFALMGFFRKILGK